MPAYNAGMKQRLKELVHWVIAIAVVIHIVVFLFTGRLDLPDVPF